MRDRALLLGVLLMGLVGGALFGLWAGDASTRARAYQRGYAAACDSVVAAHEQWGYVLMRGDQRVRITVGVMDSLWVSRDDFYAVPVGWRSGR